MRKEGRKLSFDFLPSILISEKRNISMGNMGTYKIEGAPSNFLCTHESMFF
jgi:hypothetical protein